MPATAKRHVSPASAPQRQHGKRQARMLQPWDATPVNLRHELLLAFEGAYNDYRHVAFGSELQGNASLLWVVLLLRTPTWVDELEIRARLEKALAKVFIEQRPFNLVSNRSGAPIDPQVMVDTLYARARDKYNALVVRQEQGLANFHRNFLPRHHPALAAAKGA